MLLWRCSQSFWTTGVWFQLKTLWKQIETISSFTGCHSMLQIVFTHTFCYRINTLSQKLFLRAFNFKLKWFWWVKPHFCSRSPFQDLKSQWAAWLNTLRYFMKVINFHWHVYKTLPHIFVEKSSFPCRILVFAFPLNSRTFSWCWEF